MASNVETNLGIDSALEAAREEFAGRHPRTQELHGKALGPLPGGNTRSVLYHRPFPLRITRAWDAILEDADGHQYIDMLGEYSAGLYGHSNPLVVEAMINAIKAGISRGAHTEDEVSLAETICERFAAVEQVRFTNSGTEANLMALSAARAFTGRDRILVFKGGYHGGVLMFKGGQSVVNAPFDVILGTYNDASSARSLIKDNADTLAGVLVEPMLGSGGCIAAESEFLAALREGAAEAGALLIFDEVMTSRTGSSGLHQRLGVTPDLVTLGKYIGGGSSFGAFGGRADIMSLFDPTQAGSLPHAGTFNNNVVSMSAGYVGLTQVYTPEAAERHTARGDALREELNYAAASIGVPFTVTGVGSLMAIHATDRDIRTPGDLADVDPRLQELLFLDLLREGFYIAPRGFIALSVVVEEEQLQAFIAAFKRVLTTRKPLYPQANWAGTAVGP